MTCLLRPVLVDVRKDGQGEPIPAVIQATERGEYLPARPPHRRADLRQFREVAVPQNPAEGEKVTATQPMSPLPNFRADRVEKDMWGMTPLRTSSHCRIGFKKMRYEGHFAPPMPGGGGYGQAMESWCSTFQYPGDAGGFNWGSVSVDADNGPGDRRAHARWATVSCCAALRIARRRLRRCAERAKPKDEHAAAAPAAPAGATPSPEAIEHNKRFDQKRVLYGGDTAPFMSDWRTAGCHSIHDADNQLLSTNLPCFEPPFGRTRESSISTPTSCCGSGRLGRMKESGPLGAPTGLPFTVGTPLQAGNTDDAWRG